MRARESILVTGASGLVGRGAVTRLLRARPALRVVALTRDPGRLARVAASEAWDGRVTALAGDLTRPGLGLTLTERARLARHVGGVLHCAADTTFSRPLDEARRVNAGGTAHVLDVMADWPRAPRFAYVSTAFVAGRATGIVPEAPVVAAPDGWVNGYEQSKWEAEALVRAACADAVVLRSSTIAADRDGVVRQQNAVHRALRVYHAGLAAMLPWAPGAALDVVPGDWACDAVARLAFAPEAAGCTVHLCAGDGALPIEEMLDRTWAAWARDEAWRRRRVARPALADLGTWELFARSVRETGNVRLARVLAALDHFVPQLALSKRFGTTVAARLLGAPPPRAADWWDAMLAHLGPRTGEHRPGRAA